MAMLSHIARRGCFGYDRSMKEGPDIIAQIGALIGDPARANMLTALMDGRALTATGAGGGLAALRCRRPARIYSEKLERVVTCATQAKAGTASLYARRRRRSGKLLESIMAVSLRRVDICATALARRAGTTQGAHLLRSRPRRRLRRAYARQPDFDRCDFGGR